MCLSDAKTAEVQGNADNTGKQQVCRARHMNIQMAILNCRVCQLMGSLSLATAEGGSPATGDSVGGKQPRTVY